MSRFLVVPLLKSLKWVNVYVGNYGWSMLTVIINAIKNAPAQECCVDAKMQEIQPR